MSHLNVDEKRITLYLVDGCVCRQGIDAITSCLFPNTNGSVIGRKTGRHVSPFATVSWVKNEDISWRFKETNFSFE